MVLSLRQNGLSKLLPFYLREVYLFKLKLLFKFGSPALEGCIDICARETRFIVKLLIVYIEKSVYCLKVARTNLLSHLRHLVKNSELRQMNCDGRKDVANFKSVPEHVDKLAEVALR